MLYHKVWKRPTEQKRDQQIKEAITYCHRSRRCYEGSLAYAPGDRPCLEAQTKYNTCTCSDGWPIYAPTEEECRQKRAQYERELPRAINALCNWLTLLCDEPVVKFGHFSPQTVTSQSGRFAFVLRYHRTSRGWYARRIR